MKNTIKWTNEPAFINRGQELSDLRNWISEKPNNILFLYGPKSSGKTTLLHKFIDDNLSEKKFDIKHFNLREILIVNYEDFIQTFFTMDYSKSKGDIKERREYNLKVFKLTTEILKGLDQKKLDPFAVMKKEMQASAAKGIRPVIIIDELQALEGIYFNGQRELLKELFNFFVAMTKESHLCHVIIASSDGYFIERIYNDSKLKKTSKFLEVDYLNKEDTMFWLGDLKKQSNITSFTLTDSQKNQTWNTFGGSCWDISALLGDLLLEAENDTVSDENFNKVLQKKLIASRSLFEDYAGLNSQKIGIFNAVNAIYNNKSFLKLTDLKDLVRNGLFTEPLLRNELGELVRQNFLSYNPVTAEYKLQGKNMELGLRMFVKMINEDAF